MYEQNLSELIENPEAAIQGNPTTVQLCYLYNLLNQWFTQKKVSDKDWQRVRIKLAEAIRKKNGR